MMLAVMLLPLRVIVMLVITGGSAAMVMITGATSGVMFWLLEVMTMLLSVMVIAPASVPVCSAMVGAAVVLAAMSKVKVRVPLAKTMFGSSTPAAPSKVRVRVAVNSTG